MWKRKYTLCGLLALCAVALGAFFIVQPVIAYHNDQSYNLYTVAQVKQGLRTDPRHWRGHPIYVRGLVGPMPWPLHKPVVMFLFVDDPQLTQDAELMIVESSAPVLYPPLALTHLPLIGSWFSQHLLRLGPHEQIVKIRLTSLPLCDRRWSHPFHCAVGVGQWVH